MRCDGQDTTPQMWKFRWELLDYKRKEYRRGVRGEVVSVQSYKYTVTLPPPHHPTRQFSSAYIYKESCLPPLLYTRSCRVTIVVGKKTKKTMPPPPHPHGQLPLFCYRLPGLHPSPPSTPDVSAPSTPYFALAFFSCCSWYRVQSEFLNF